MELKSYKLVKENKNKYLRNLPVEIIFKNKNKNKNYHLFIRIWFVLQFLSRVYGYKLLILGLYYNLYIAFYLEFMSYKLYA